MTRRTGTLSIVALLCFAAALAVAACGGHDETKDEPEASKIGETADETSADGKAPKIVAVEETFNFGKVKQGKNPEHVFKIKNEGDADLKIEKARGS